MTVLPWFVYFFESWKSVFCKLGQIHSSFRTYKMKFVIQICPNLYIWSSSTIKSWEKKGHVSTKSNFSWSFIAQNVQLWSKIDILNFYAENLTELNHDEKFSRPIKYFIPIRIWWINSTSFSKFKFDVFDQITYLDQFISKFVRA